MTQYRTAQGKVLDMGAFVAKNDRVRAVGNMKVNARGDTIDSDGRVVQSLNDKINTYYSDSISNPAALGKGVAPKTPQITATAAPKVINEELTEIERELEKSLEEPVEEEIPVQLESEKPSKSKK